MEYENCHMIMSGAAAEMFPGIGYANRRESPGFGSLIGTGSVTVSMYADVD